jgi:hypothetical protein
MNDAAEIGIAAALQLIALIWYLSGLRTDVRNLKDTVQTIDARTFLNATDHANLKGHVESLPCSRCDLTIGT